MIQIKFVVFRCDSSEERQTTTHRQPKQEIQKNVEPTKPSTIGPSGSDFLESVLRPTGIKSMQEKHEKYHHRQKREEKEKKYKLKMKVVTHGLKDADRKLIKKSKPLRMIKANNFNALLYITKNKKKKEGKRNEWEIKVLDNTFKAPKDPEFQLTVYMFMKKATTPKPTTTSKPKKEKDNSVANQKTD